MTVVSVIMPNFNKGPYIEHSIRSVLAQTLTDFELVIVDDGSTDGSIETVEKMAKHDGRVRLIKHERNQGVAAARNTGIRSATSKVLTFIDSDDLFAPERLRRIVEVLADSEAVVYSDPITVSEEARAVAAEPSKAPVRPSGMILKDLLGGVFRFIAGPISAPKECFEAAGLYDESLHWGEDFDMALRLSEKFPFVYDNLCTYGYRIYDANVLVGIQKKERWSRQGEILERRLKADYGQLDETARRTAFRYLFSCFLASRHWGGIVRYGFTREAAFREMLGLPLRSRKLRTS
jgi:glycosyltransferase involved in cell wall biosynthesis